MLSIRDIDKVGQLMFLSVDLDDQTEVRIESHVEKLGDRGWEPATKVHLSWQADRATVVAATCREHRLMGELSSS